MPLVILHHLLNVSVQLANKRGLKKNFMYVSLSGVHFLHCIEYWFIENKGNSKRFKDKEVN
jgi:hypothetical protein